MPRLVTLKDTLSGRQGVRRFQRLGHSSRSTILKRLVILNDYSYLIAGTVVLVDMVLYDSSLVCDI